MHNVEEIISEIDLDRAFGNSNFGTISKREVVRNSLLKCVGGFRTGHTAKCIVEELGLVRRSEWKITKLGGRYLFAAYSNGVSV